MNKGDTSDKVRPARKNKDTPLMTSTWVSTLYVDPRFLVQIVKAIIKGMTNTTPHIVSTTPTPLVTLEIYATTYVVLLVWLVKSMREMGYKPYMGEQYVEIARKWIMKVEKTMIQIKIPEDL